MLIKKKTLTSIDEDVNFLATFIGFYCQFVHWAYMVNEEEARLLAKLVALKLDLEIETETESTEMVLLFDWPTEEESSRVVYRSYIRGGFEINTLKKDSEVFNELMSLIEELTNQKACVCKGFFDRYMVSEQEKRNIDESVREHVAWFKKYSFGIESAKGLESLIWSIENEHQAAVLLRSAPDKQKPKV